MKMVNSIAVIILTTLSVSASYTAAQSGRLSVLRPIVSAPSKMRAPPDKRIRVPSWLSPQPLTDAAYLDAELAPLFQNVRNEVQVPDEANARFNDMLRATFCEGLLYTLKTGEVPSALSIGPVLDRNLTLYSLVANTEVRTAISVGLSIALWDPAETTPQEFVTEARLQDACEKFFRGEL